MAAKVHPVVEDAHDFDRALGRDAIHEEVASAPTASCNVERAKTRRDFVPGFGACNLRTIGEFANRLNQHVPIDAGLSRPEIFSGPFQNIRKIDFRGSAETDAPLLPGHTALFARSGDNLLREISQIGLQVFDCLEFFEFAPFQRPDAKASRGA